VTTHTTENLQELITRARCVLLDFDGPVCRLFAGHSATRVTRALVALLAERGALGLLTEEERWSSDPGSCCGPCTGGSPDGNWWWTWRSGSPRRNCGRR
jgi:hypothetical protein